MQVKEQPLARKCERCGREKISFVDEGKEKKCSRCGGNLLIVGRGVWGK